MEQSGSQKWARGSIRIISESMTAQEISDAVGLQPTRMVEKGTQAQTRSGKGAIWTASTWLLDSGLPSTAPGEEHVETLVRILESREETIGQLAARCRIELFIGYSSDNGQGSLVFDHGILRRLAQLPVDIVLDLYPPTAEDE